MNDPAKGGSLYLNTKIVNARDVLLQARARARRPRMHACMPTAKQAAPPAARAGRRTRKAAEPRDLVRAGLPRLGRPAAD